MSLVHLGSSEFVRCVLYGTCILILCQGDNRVVKEGDIFVAWGYKPNLEIKMEAPGILHIIVTLFSI